MIWEILKIEETTDKRAITRAYRDQLSEVNPEEKPEEFKLLRGAYEDALKWADEKRNEEEAAANGEEKSKTPIEVWTDRLAAIYGNLSSRRDVNAWKELLSDDLCVSLDTKPDIQDALLRFFMEHFRVDSDVMQVLHDEFHFEEQLEDLNARYPEDFIHYIIMDGLTVNQPVALDLFPEGTSGEAADEYIRSYLEFSRSNFAEAEDIYNRFRALPVKHPCGESLCMRYEQYKGDETAVDRLQEFCADYPDNIRIQNDLMLACFNDGRYEEALQAAEKFLEKDPDMDNALQVKAHSLAALKNYKDAVETINKIMNLSDGNQKRIYELDEIRREWNEALIAQYEEAYQAGTADDEKLGDLIWCYLQNEKHELAMERFPALSENYPSAPKYLYLKFLLEACNHMSEQALQTADVYMEAEKQAQKEDEEHLNREQEAGETDESSEETKKDEDPTKASPEEEMRKRKIRMSDLLVRKGTLLLDLKRYDEVQKVLDQAKEITPDDAELFTRSTYFYLKMKKYPEALETAQEIIRVAPNSYHGYLLAGMAQFHMGMDNDAFSYINHSIDLDGSDLTAYLFKLRILVRNNAFEPAEGLIEFLEENGITEDITVEWCKIQMLVRKEKKNEEALERYRALDARIKESEDKPEWLPAFYYLMAICLADVKDAKEDYTRADILEVLSRGLAADPDDFDCQEYTAWLLKKDKKIDESLAIYHKLEKEPRNNLYVEKQLAELYYEDDFNNAAKSLHYYEMLSEVEDENREYHLNMAYLLYIMKNFEDTEKHLNRTLEISPNDAWTYYRFSQLYLVQRKLEEAYSYARKAVDAIKERIEEPSKRRPIYWQNVAQCLRRMGKPYEAVVVYKEALTECGGYKTYYKDIISTYMTFGLWKQTEAAIEEWKKSRLDPAASASDKAYYEGITGQYAKMERTIRMNRSLLKKDDLALAEAILAASKNDLTVNLKRRKDQLDEARTNGKDNLCYEYSGYAIALWFCGYYDEAKKEAENAVNEYERYKNQYDMVVPIYCGSAAVAMAILGRLDDARRTVNLMNICPVCSHCKYRSCKDFYVYAAEIELVYGNGNNARTIIAEGRQADPSEECFLFCEAYMRKVGI